MYPKQRRQRPAKFSGGGRAGKSLTCCRRGGAACGLGEAPVIPCKTPPQHTHKALHVDASEGSPDGGPGDQEQRSTDERQIQ